MVPDGWSHGQVQDFLVLQRGFDLTQKNALPGKVPVYSSSGLSYFHSEAKVKGPGIVTGRKGSVGPVYFINEDFWPHDTTLWVKDFKGNDIHYIEYFLRFLRLEKFDEASSVPTLNRNNVHGVKCIFPPLIEQTRIAQFLSTWDQAITATERLLENSQQRKKGLMQQLLTGKKRLPGFEGEWSYQEIGKFLIESRIQSDSNDPSKRLTVRLNLKGIEQREVRGTEAKGSTAHYVRLAGQFIYGKQNIHKAAFGLIPEKFDKFETSQDLPAFDFKEGVDSHWFLYFCSQEWFYTDLEKKMTGTGSKRLNPKAFLKVKLPTPSFDEQRAIAEVLDLASRDIDAIKTKLELLQNEKKALMQQLLTGKRRVNVETEAA